MKNHVECQINLCCTSQEDESIGDDVVFDLIVKGTEKEVRKALIIAARGAMEALQKEGIKAYDLTT